MRLSTRTMAQLALAAVAALSFFAFTLSSSAASTEEAKLVYNAQMSWTGNCTTSEEDPIADPGCPGGSHPPKPFSNPAGVATDPHGDIYVASLAKASRKTIIVEGHEQEVMEGRIDVFNPQGEYLTETKDEYGPLNIAVDSQGDIYVVNETGNNYEPGQTEYQLQLYRPKSYPPAVGTEYEGPVVIEKNNKSDAQVHAVAVDPSNDHLYAALEFHGIVEYGSAAEELPGGEWGWRREELDASVTAAGGRAVGGIAVYGHNHDIYAGGYTGEFSGNGTQAAFVIDGATGALKCVVEGTPTGAFSSGTGKLGVGVDQANGDLLVADLSKNHVIDEFSVEESGCKYIGQLPIEPPKLIDSEFWSSVAVDTTCTKSGGEPCDAEYDSPNEGSVYVGSGYRESNSHLFAYTPKLGGPPEVEGQGVEEVGETEAVFAAKVNPHDLGTHYWFEYVTQAAFAAHGYEDASRVPTVPADAGSGASFVPVSARVPSLQPGASYRFRLVASNCEDPEAVEGQCLTQGEGVPGGEGTDVAFATYRVLSAGLPDGRGYELVTPPDTGGYTPTMSQLGYGYETTQGTPFASADGNGLLFGIGGGALPGYPGSGRRDTFEARREPDGRWQSVFNGIAGAQSENPSPGLFSEDHSVSTWFFAVPNDPYTGAYHLRRTAGSVDRACGGEPEGTLELVGCGSLGTYPYAAVRWMAPDAGHIVFETLKGPASSEAIRALEPGAPEGKSAIYDRTPGGVTHLVSLLPGGVPLTDDAHFVGASEDGTAVAFQANDGAESTTMYVRLDDERTVEVAHMPHGDEAWPAGFSPHGDRLVYLVPNASQPILEGSRPNGGEGVLQGEIYVCEVRTAPCAGEGAQSPIPIGSGDESTVVNVSADGSHVFFVSPKTLDSKHLGHEGAENLYVWDGSAVRFIADVSRLDVIGSPGPRNDERVGGLGAWVGEVVGSAGTVRGPGAEPSRTTASGGTLVFESHADLTGYESAGHSEIYRYDSEAQAGHRLSCLSCNPTGVPAASDSQLQGDAPEVLTFLPPVDELASLASLSANGRRLFFQTGERLVSADTDNKIDVYEWEAAGEGGCSSEAPAFVAADSGCLYLISSGRSAADSYLYAVSPDGSNVFFETDDVLTPRDRSATPSIYDARVGGGEPPIAAPEPECGGETCQSPAPVFEAFTPSSFTFTGPGNLTPKAQGGQHKGAKRVGAAGHRRRLRDALKSCEHRFQHNRSGRRACERRARRMFAAKSAGRPRKHKRNHHRGRGSR